MSDWYLLLTPILMLGVVALLGFVGCDVVFGLDEVRPVPPLPAPANFQAIAGNGKVNLSWDAYTGAIVFNIMRRGENEAYAPLETVVGTTLDKEDSPLPNGVKFYYALTATLASRETMPAEAEATPGLGVLTPFVMSTVPGTLVNTLDGWAGMGIQVGPDPITVSTLGRLCAPGNGRTHAVKVVDGTTRVDVPGGSVGVSMSGAEVGKFVHEPLASPITLAANAEYFIVSQEEPGLDFYHNADTTIMTTAVAARTFLVYGDNAGSYVVSPEQGVAYGPVNFEY